VIKFTTEALFENFRIGDDRLAARVLLRPFHRLGRAFLLVLPRHPVGVDLSGFPNVAAHFQAHVGMPQRGFRQTLKAGGKQDNVYLLEAPPQNNEGKNFDAVLTFNVLSWGLRLPNRDEERLAPFIELETTLNRYSDNQTLWNMHDTFLGKSAVTFQIRKTVRCCATS
jgi:hypothetical protein